MGAKFLKALVDWVAQLVDHLLVFQSWGLEVACIVRVRFKNHILDIFTFLQSVHVEVTTNQSYRVPIIDSIQFMLHECREFSDLFLAADDCLIEYVWILERATWLIVHVEYMYISKAHLVATHFCNRSLRYLNLRILTSQNGLPLTVDCIAEWKELLLFDFEPIICCQIKSASLYLPREYNDTTFTHLLLCENRRSLRLRNE